MTAKNKAGAARRPRPRPMLLNAANSLVLASRRKATKQATNNAAGMARPR